MITITLEVTPKQLLDIAKVLNTSPESISEPTGPNLCQEIPLPTKPASKPTEAPRPIVPKAPKPNGKKASKMPAFGRTQDQVNTFIENEKNRVAVLDEAAQLKQQRAEEKAAREEVAIKEIEKAKEEEVSPVKAPMSAKLWNL